MAVIARVAEGNASTSLDTERVDLCLVDIEGDGHREEDAASETVVGDDTVIMR